MHDALLIAKREYLERVRSKTFLFTTVVLPLLMGLLMGGGILASHQGARGPHTIVIASNDSELAQNVKTELESRRSLRYTVNVLAPVTESERDEITPRAGRTAIRCRSLASDGAGRHPAARDL